MANIAFIGLGNMGAPMAANLVKAGHEVTGFDLVEAQRAAAAASGVAIAQSARAAVEGAEAVVTMLPAGRHVIACWADILPAARRGALVIDSSTIDVASAKAAHEAGASAGVLTLDAPVSGGVGGASAGTLTFMAGGADEAFARAKPLLEAMGKRIVHCGGPGAGQAAKICNNMILGATMIATCEAFVLAEKLGLSAAGAFRRRLDFVGPVLVADLLLPGPRARSRFARQSWLQARLRGGADAQGPAPRAGGGRRRGRGDAAGRRGRSALPAVCGGGPRGRRLFGDHQVPARHDVTGEF